MRKSRPSEFNGQGPLGALSERSYYVKISIKWDLIQLLLVSNQMTLKLFQVSTVLLVLGYFSYANAAQSADAPLEALVSSDESTRKTALQSLEREFASPDPSGLKSGYQRYGNDLLPHLSQSIREYDDRNTRYALAALFHMAMVHRMRLQMAGMSEEVIAAFEDLEHIPDPSNYGPLKETLILTLNESTYEVSRALSAKVLGMSFGPSTEVEKLLFDQLVKDRSRKARRGIMEGVAHLATRAGYSGTEYLSVLGVRGTYSYFDKGANVADGGWTGVLLPDQSVNYERGTGVTFDFTIDSVSEDEYVLHYRLYDLYEGRKRASDSSLKEEISGQVEGNFGATVNLDVETIDLRIETTVFVERIPKCPKKQLKSCFR